MNFLTADRYVSNLYTERFNRRQKSFEVTVLTCNFVDLSFVENNDRFADEARLNLTLYFE